MDDQGPAGETILPPARLDPPAEVSVVARPVFVIDNDPESRREVAACLSRLGLTNPRVELADGDEAIAELGRCRQLGSVHLPVLVLLDRQLSDRPGADVLRWMRSTPAFDHVPVVALSADAGARTVTEAYQLGVRCYLVKPVGFSALGGVIRDLGLPWMLT